MEVIQKGIADLGKRLYNLMGKVGCNLSTYQGQDWSITLLKDFVYDIDDKVQQMSL